MSVDRPKLSGRSGPRLAVLTGLCALLLVASACGQTGPARIDGSTDEAFAGSLKAMRQELHESQRLRFEAALTVIEAKELMMADDRPAYRRALRRKLDGMTADEVVAEAAEAKSNLGDATVDSFFELKRELADRVRNAEERASSTPREAAPAPAKTPADKQD
jgi:hypothetical protein